MDVTHVTHLVDTHFQPTSRAWRARQTLEKADQLSLNALPWRRSPTLCSRDYYHGSSIKSCMATIMKPCLHSDPSAVLLLCSFCAETVITSRYDISYLKYLRPCIVTDRHDSTGSHSDWSVRLHGRENLPKLQQQGNIQRLWRCRVFFFYTTAGDNGSNKARR